LTLAPTEFTLNTRRVLESPQGLDTIDPVQDLINGVRSQIQQNPYFWPGLLIHYGNLGIIPGTGSTIRDFYYTHYLAHKYLLVVVNHAPSLYSESKFLHPEAGAEYQHCHSQFTYNDNESDFGAPEEQDFTINSPHPPTGLTPALVPQTLSAHSGKVEMQSSTLQPTTPSQERES
jgi:hypothetical protein